MTVSPWRRALSVGLFLAAAATVVIQLLAGALFPPLAIFAVVFTVVAVALRRGAPRWVEWLALGLGVVFIVGNLPFAIADLAHPESVAGFAPALVAMVTALFVVLAALMARRGASVAPGRVGAAFAAVVVVGIAVSGALSAGLSDDERQDADVVVVAKSVEYPERVEAGAGQVSFFVENEDPFRHTFVIEGTEVEQELPGGTARRVEATLEPGEYRYFCDVPGHEDMEGTLIVGS